MLVDIFIEEKQNFVVVISSNVCPTLSLKNKKKNKNFLCFKIKTTARRHNKTEHPLYVIVLFEIMQEKNVFFSSFYHTQ